MGELKTFLVVNPASAGGATGRAFPLIEAAVYGNIVARTTRGGAVIHGGRVIREGAIGDLLAGDRELEDVFIELIEGAGGGTGYGPAQGWASPLPPEQPAAPSQPAAALPPWQAAPPPSPAPPSPAPPFPAPPSPAPPFPAPPSPAPPTEHPPWLSP